MGAINSLNVDKAIRPGDNHSKLPKEKAVELIFNMSNLPL